MLFLVIVCILGSASAVYGDTPANCTYEDIRGTWVFSIGNTDNDRTVDCTSFEGPVVHQVKIQLLFPDIAIDDFGNKGFWTIIYNQGFEVVVAGRKYFAFSKYVGNVSYCHDTLPGWSHDVLGQDWACYNGKKQGSQIIKPLEQKEEHSLLFQHQINSEEMVASINYKQKSWKAVRYSQFDGLSREDFLNMAGGRAYQSRPKPAPLTKEHHKLMESLPEAFDWRNVDGVNFVSPVRNQGGCGSCYAFASLGMNEARVRIQTNNTQTPVFSPQDIVECSEYSQGCGGGFPYLIGGKYSEDFGLVKEKCNPYTGNDGPCKTDPKCKRHYFTGYRYIGGFYGGCNEPLMMQAIYKDGPIAINFQVYTDLLSYKSGIYHHTTMDKGLTFNPFELTNHVVVAVGWGADPKTGEKYWIVKNSWGTNCNEPLMMQAIYKDGPIAINFQVYTDLFLYKSGIYHHTTMDKGLTFNPFELTNHVVVAVGWGADPKTGEKYWIVKNSWGTNCNEPLMMQAVMDRGPIVVGFEVYDDFFSYKSGIYHHNFGRENSFKPFELTNHAVLVVGWGVDAQSGVDYWIVKNSWGETWGQNGYFWIRKGNDECGLESMAAETEPVIKFTA